jgi:adenine-specific DNA-methyltransferase
LILGLQKNTKGLAPFWYGSIISTSHGNIPVYVPNLLNSQEKTVDIFFLYKIIHQEIAQLKMPAKKVIAYYIVMENREELNLYIKKENHSGVEIELRDLKNLLHHLVFEDVIVENELAFAEEYIVEIKSFLSDRLLKKTDEFNQKKALKITRTLSHSKSAKVDWN